MQASSSYECKQLSRGGMDDVETVLDTMCPGKFLVASLNDELGWGYIGVILVHAII